MFSALFIMNLNIQFNFQMVRSEVKTEICFPAGASEVSLNYYKTSSWQSGRCLTKCSQSLLALKSINFSNIISIFYQLGSALKISNSSPIRKLKLFILKLTFHPDICYISLYFYISSVRNIIYLIINLFIFTKFKIRECFQSH